MYQNQKDETLMMLTLAGEQNAYSALVARYENAVIAAAASITHNRHMAEDSAQDAFIAAWIKLNMLREPCKYGAWGWRIHISNQPRILSILQLEISIIAIQQKDKQVGAKRLIVLSASLSDSEREVGESKGRGQRPQSLCVFCTVVILFKLFLDCYSLLVLCQYKKGLV